MEQFNQHDSNDQSNYNSSNQNQSISHNTNVNSNGARSYSNYYVKRHATYNAMNADSYNVVHNNPQSKKQLLNGLIMLGIVCVVAIVGFTKFKGPREFICGSANYIINFIQGRDENGITKIDYSTWSRKDLEGKGFDLRPYNPQTDKDKLDRNGFERDLNISEDYLSSPAVIESGEKRQVGPILKNRVANNKQDEQKLFNLYKLYCTNKEDNYKDIVIHHKYSTKGQADFIGLLNRRHGYKMCVAKDDGTHQPSGITVWKPILLSYSDQKRNKPTYVDKNGNAVDYYKSAHRDSLMSVARYMLYEQGFESTTVTPGGVVGVVDIPDPSEDDYYEYRIYQVVIPSKDNPNKFDVFIDTIHLKYDPEYGVDEDNLVVDPFLSVDQAIVLRDTNKHILPFRVVIHDIDRPLNNTPTDNDRYNTELLKVMKKFDIKIK